MTLLFSQHPSQQMNQTPFPPSVTWHRPVLKILLSSTPPQHSGCCCSNLSPVISHLDYVTVVIWQLTLSPGLLLFSPHATRTVLTKHGTCSLLDIFNRHEWLHFGFGKKSIHTKATMYDLTVTFQSNFMMSGCSLPVLHIFFPLSKSQPWVFSYVFCMSLAHVILSASNALSSFQHLSIFCLSNAFSLLIFLSPTWNILSSIEFRPHLSSKLINCTSYSALQGFLLLYLFTDLFSQSRTVSSSRVRPAPPSFL